MKYFFTIIYIIIGMVATVDNYGPDALEDWEVDELLDWTTSLNFEE